ncbi:MAG: acetyl-CoA synthase subunit gamma [Nitrospirae bacterium]|nr:acetyl-CoA synthase subunit gamma [Nitrospirota bacterium]MBF0534142.1 acetyl-CoA synthase subunit gamma [Nitrospirota bacterium]MBF0617029.1 acetyl-CoA synthase subunit gamma [Nitrospirota bacterium]
MEKDKSLDTANLKNECCVPKHSSTGCGCNAEKPVLAVPEATLQHKKWITGTVNTPACIAYKVSTEITKSELLEHLLCRISGFRNSYTVTPGLYAVGEPDQNSHVVVTANYKLTFDKVRESLSGENVWIMVLDTKGINVWCAAGKGTFGTEEMINRILKIQLTSIVTHRKIIVPQLGAPGVSAHTVKKATGFQVLFGPVYACDLKDYIRSGCVATKAMRNVSFSMIDRLVLTPMEIIPSMRIFAVFAVVMFLFFGVSMSGINFATAIKGAFPFFIFGLIAILSGAFITPLLLPAIPFKSFAVKGWIVGIFMVWIFRLLFSWLNSTTFELTVFAYVLFPMISSYVTLQFTGATTFTGMSGVKKELKYAVPLYIASAVISVVVLALYKVNQWRVL